MNIHEYQAKALLNKFGINTQKGELVSDPNKAIDAAKKLQDKTGTKHWVVKAQIHAGGRGKGGGIKLAKTLEEVKEKTSQIIGMNLVTPQTGSEGKLVRKVFITEDAYYDGPSKPKELYISILLDRAKECNAIIYSTEGGMDIEEVAKNTPKLIHKEYIDPAVGLQMFQARKLAFNLGLQDTAMKEMTKFISQLYQAYISSDSSLFEINPALKTSDDKIIAVDAKVNIDDNALYRHPDIAQMRDKDEEDPTEVEAGEYNLNYVKLDGNVGCMVNGAGLAMATMDIIKLAGGDPANFLDVGGTANAETVQAGFKIILKDPNVKAILINIFGGIVRCDRVAQGIIDAYKNMGDTIKVPIIVRLQGTNAKEAKDLIDKSGLKVLSATLLKEAAELVTKVIS